MTRVFATVVLASVAGVVSAQRAPAVSQKSPLVSVDVSVADGKEPVSGLTATDFDLRDDKVVQHIDQFESRTSPLDVTIVLDVSGSVSGALEEELARAAQGMRQGLHADDTSESIAVDRDLRRMSDAREWMPEVPLRIGDGGTRLFDAVVAAVLEPERAGRRHVVVVLTDGLDTGGVIDRATRLAVLGRSGTVVDLAAIGVNPRQSGVRYHDANVPGEPVEIGDYDHLLREMTDVTGGAFVDTRLGDPLAGTLTDDLDRLRQYYTLSYRPTGAAGARWHALAVQVTTAAHTVRARRGYFGQ